MQQVVDLQKDQDFQALNVELLSISPDPLDAWETDGKQYQITLPMLSDAANEVANKYGVMRWAMGDEPGHTFVLVDETGKVAWVQDYGAEENGGLMYVPPEDLVPPLEKALT